MTTEIKSYGKATVGFATNDQREINITEFVQCHFKDNRTVSICELEKEEGLLLTVENILSSGRWPQSIMWLSKESTVALLNTILIYFMAKGEDFNQLVSETAKDDKIEFSYSDNLKPNHES